MKSDGDGTENDGGTDGASGGLKSIPFEKVEEGSKESNVTNVQGIVSKENVNAGGIDDGIKDVQMKSDGDATENPGGTDGASGGISGLGIPSIKFPFPIVFSPVVDLKSQFDVAAIAATAVRNLFSRNKPKIVIMAGKEIEITSNTSDEINLKFLMNGVDDDHVKVTLSPKLELVVKAYNPVSKDNHDYLISLLEITGGNFVNAKYRWYLSHGDLYITVTNFKTNEKVLTNLSEKE